MQMFDAMVACRDQHGGVDILGIPLYFVLPMRAKEMAAETMGVAPPAQHVFRPSYIIECSGMGLGLSDMNLDEIGATVRAALGGLKVATTMRYRIRDGITGAASQVVAHMHARNDSHLPSAAGELNKGAYNGTVRMHVEFPKEIKLCLPLSWMTTLTMPDTIREVISSRYENTTIVGQSHYMVCCGAIKGHDKDQRDRRDT